MRKNAESNSIARAITRLTPGHYTTRSAIRSVRREETQRGCGYCAAFSGMKPTFLYQPLTMFLSDQVIFSIIACSSV